MALVTICSDFEAQESWDGSPSPVDLPDPGIEPGSPALQADSLPAEPPGKQNRKFISWGSKITEDVDYSHEIKRCLLFGRKAMANLDSMLKSRDITLQTKVF